MEVKRNGDQSKQENKIEIEKNEDPLEDTVLQMTADEEEPEAKIEDLPGVGPQTAEKLREAGFDDLLSLAVAMSPADLAEQAEIGESVAGKIIAAAKKMANIGGFVSGGDLLEREKSSKSYHPRYSQSMTY